MCISLQINNIRAKFQEWNLILNAFIFDCYNQFRYFKMGVAKSVAHMNSYNEHLYFYIDRNQFPKIKQILAKKPDLIKQDLTLKSKTTALNRACYNGNLQLVKIFVQQYHADVNLVAGNGETPLIAAIKRNYIHIVRYLLQKGADPDYQSKTHQLKVVQYAILQGLYEAALMVYEKMKNKQLRPHASYRDIALEHKYRYVNYKVFLQSLVDMVDPQNTRDYLTKQKKIYSDPVIDPRQSWKQWFWRNADFKDPPLVQRSELPEELQPQNLKFAKARHFFHKLTLSPLSPIPSLQPENKTEFQESNNALKNQKKNMDKIQLQTIS